ASPARSEPWCLLSIARDNPPEQSVRPAGTPTHPCSVRNPRVRGRHGAAYVASQPAPHNMKTLPYVAADGWRSSIDDAGLWVRRVLPVWEEGFAHSLK